MDTVAMDSEAGVSTSQKPLFAPPTRLLLPSPAATTASPADHAERKPFDEKDERVYFDRQSGSWRCEVDCEGGTEEIEWNPEKQAWIVVMDEESIRAQQAAYSVQGVDEETPAAPVLRREKKRQKDEEAGPSKRLKPTKPRINTSIFVSGLPLDCTKAEIAEVFSRYGVLNEDDAGEPRVKTYADERTGMFKGEALITYFKPESVDLAIRVLDESALRAADGKRDPIMKIQRAEFGVKTQGKEISAADLDNTRKQTETNGQPKQKTEAEKRRAQKRFAKMNNKVTDWDSDSNSDPDGQGSSASGMPVVGSGVRQVCLRRMFTLAELDEDPTLLLDLTEDVREECEILGKVTNVVLWDASKEPEGIMTVKYSSQESALACVQKMNDRFFGGRQVIAHLLEGKPRFRRTGRGGDEEREEDETEEQKRRQDAFGEWLEAGGDEAGP